MNSSSRAGTILRMATAKYMEGGTSTNLATGGVTEEDYSTNQTTSGYTMQNNEDQQPDFGSSSSTVQEFTDSTFTRSEPDGNNVYKVLCNYERPTMMRLTKLKEKNYCVSAIHSSESDIDDSDADPDFINSSSDSAGEHGVQAKIGIEEEKKRKKRNENLKVG